MHKPPKAKTRIPQTTQLIKPISKPIKPQKNFIIGQYIKKATEARSKEERKSIQASKHQGHQTKRNVQGNSFKHQKPSDSLITGQKFTEAKHQAHRKKKEKKHTK